MKQTFISVITIFSFLFSIKAQEVKICGNMFTVNGKHIWFNGINTPWENFNDLGGSFNYEWWNSEFQKYADNHINLARVWIHCEGKNSPETDSNGYVAGASDLFWKQMDQLVRISKEKKVYLLPSLWSFDMVNDKNATFGKYRKLLNDTNNIKSYIDNFLIPLIKRYNNEPYILAWEICNEPEWMMEHDADGKFPRTVIQLFHAMCAAAIHKNCKKPVTTGSASVKWNSTIFNYLRENAGNCWSDSALKAVYKDKNAYLDFYQVHWYAWQAQHLSSPYIQTTRYYKIDDKPVIIGESVGADVCDPYFCQTLVQMYENAWLNGYSGVCAWKTLQNDGQGTFENISVATNIFYKNHPALVFP